MRFGGELGIANSDNDSKRMVALSKERENEIKEMCYGIQMSLNSDITVPRATIYIDMQLIARISSKSQVEVGNMLKVRVLV